MSKQQTPMKISDFLAKLREKAEGSSQETLDKIKEKLEKQQQERIEGKILSIHSTIQRHVGLIRDYRRAIDSELASIHKLEEQADRVIRGEDV
jgi:hypothetical protein